MPITHRDKTAMPWTKGCLERLRLRFGIGEQGRAPSELRVNLPGHRGAAPGDEASQWSAQWARQINDGRVAKQVDEKRPNRQGSLVRWRLAPFHWAAIGSASRRASASTFSGGVSGSTPWPRLNTNGPPPSAWHNSLTAVSSEEPPVISNTGSRLP